VSLFRRNTTPTVTVADLAATMAAQPGTVVVDVREPHEYITGHVPGALSMPLATVPLRHEELPRDRTLHLICQAGGRSAQAASWLAKQGYQVVNVAGGTGAWVGNGHPVRMGRRPR
jgi:rhodanese-related sulfurtransferase